MKLIICEGCDRTGKDTLINKICSLSQNYIVRHFSTPVGKTNEDKINYQKDDFHNEFILSATRESLHKYPNDSYIWNRSHIGEYVYGTMYRNYDPSWIYELEKKMEFDKDNSIYLILLIGDPEFLIANDDGESLSDKVENRRREIELFLEAVDKSCITNKLVVKVNDGNNYKPKDVIHDEIISFLNLT